ncbi:MAG: hypothetical protein BECKG1743D_GA0114223_104293 [Candidatus Kentron sp. G]|nr:MAG: hypothetical protein BECKG1743E_GA0114224_105175 [Candidatus Kentron sp. G]VFN03083.1 MAG: hypothetical protein BECKG1743D_GA0114223_104293 [Candidatus Kentron sp. G]
MAGCAGSLRVGRYSYGIATPHNPSPYRVATMAAGHTL